MYSRLNGAELLIEAPVMPASVRFGPTNIENLVFREHPFIENWRPQMEPNPDLRTFRFPPGYHRSHAVSSCRLDPHLRVPFERLNRQHMRASEEGDEEARRAADMSCQQLMSNYALYMLEVTRTSGNPVKSGSMSQGLIVSYVGVHPHDGRWKFIRQGVYEMTSESLFNDVRHPEGMMKPSFDANEVDNREAYRLFDGCRRSHVWLC